VRSAHVTEIDALPLRAFGFLWRPVRHALGVQAFGVNAYTQSEAGGEVIEDHDETGGGAGQHQELYVVLAGRARFTVGGEEVDAPVGTLVFCDDPTERRGAVAVEPDTTVLVVGSRTGAAFEPSAWETWFRADALIARGDRAEAIAALDEGLDEYPDNVAMQYNAACLLCLAGEKERALDHLRTAAELDHDTVVGWAKDDSDLDALRKDPRLAEILTP
jgi:tetratricopeptide (TPR) repeat protein